MAVNAGRVRASTSWSNLHARVRHRISDLYLRRAARIALVVAILTFALTVIDMVEREQGGSLRLIARDWNSICFVLITIVLSIAAVAMRSRDNGEQAHGVWLASGVVASALAHTTTILFVGSGAPNSEIYFVIAVLAASGGLPLPILAFRTIAGTSIVAAIAAIALKWSSYSEPTLAAAIVFLAGVIALMINRRNYQLLCLLHTEEHELASSLQQRDKYIRTLTHDLRNPISAAPAGISLLRQTLGNGLSSESEEILDVLERSAQATHGLLEGAIEESKGSQKRPNAEESWVELSELMLAVRNELALQSRMKGVRVESDVEQAWVRSDPYSVYTILRNVATNALKFTPRGGKVQLTCSSDGVMYVRDDGVGMSAEELQAVRAAANVASRSGTFGEVGTGYGLSIVREICETIGARLDIDSAPSEGTTITVKFVR